MGVQVSKCCEGLQCEWSSGVCCCNRIYSNFNMAASVEDILDEILMSDNDSETEQLVESAGLQRVADMEEKLEAQIKTCLEAFNELDLGNNVHIFKETVRKQIKGSFQAFKPPTNPLKILFNVSLNCGSLFLKKESKFWLHLFDNVPLDMLVSPAALLVGLFFLLRTATGCFTRAFFSSSGWFMDS